MQRNAEVGLFAKPSGIKVVIIGIITGDAFAHIITRGVCTPILTENVVI
jgi:hypothetical protein